MNNVDKLHTALCMVKEAGKLSAMLKVRRSLPVFNAGDKEHEAKVIKRMFNIGPEHGAYKRISEDIIRPSFYDPTSSTVYTTAGSRRHELIHAYQNLLPAKHSSPFVSAARLPILKNYVQSPIQEIGARAGEFSAPFRQQQKAPLLHAIHKTIWQSPHYIGKTGGKAWPAIKKLRDKIPFLNDHDNIDATAGVSHYIKGLFKKQK